MAVAEARAAWQRTANRCLVQEDAKRAPKLACCPSASPAVKQTDDVGPANEADGQDSTSLGFLLFKQNPSYFNLSPSSRWWLQHNPNYGYQRPFANEQLNSPEVEMESVGSNTSSFTKVSGCLVHEEYEGLYIDECSNTGSLIGSPTKIKATPFNKDLGARMQEHEVRYSETLQNSCRVEGIRAYCAVAKEDSLGYEDTKKIIDEACFDSECNLFGDERNEPWWRTADEDELAHLVASRSLTLVENCDLPLPKKARLKNDQCDDLSYFDHDGVYASSAVLKPGLSEFSRFSTHERCKLISKSSFSRNLEAVQVHLQPGQDSSTTSDVKTNESMPETCVYENDPSKAQLLEALRHSQTRSREAEIAAKQAYAEKEHIIKLVFRQASQLFTYKQWFHLLQLENLYAQIRNNKRRPITSMFPLMLPWMPKRTRKLEKNLCRAAKAKQAKRGRSKCDINKYAVVFAVGLSLVGAGLLLGWTVGWMLPKF